MARSTASGHFHFQLTARSVAFRAFQSLRQPELAEIFRHAVEDGRGEHHCLFEFCNRQIGIVTHQLGKGLLSLFGSTGSRQARRQIAIDPMSVWPLLEAAPVERGGLVVFLRYFMRLHNC